MRKSSLDIVYKYNTIMDICNSPKSSVLVKIYLTDKKASFEVLFFID